MIEIFVQAGKIILGNSFLKISNLACKLEVLFWQTHLKSVARSWLCKFLDPD